MDQLEQMLAIRLGQGHGGTLQGPSFATLAALSWGDQHFRGWQEKHEVSSYLPSAVEVFQYFIS